LDGKTARFPLENKRLAEENFDISSESHIGHI